MKIGILTLPPISNYGGILQAWALQTILERLGHNVEIIDVHNHYRRPFFIRWLIYCYRALYKLFKDSQYPVFAEREAIKFRTMTTKNTQKFINKHLKLFSCKNLHEIHKDRFDAIIVGSDQIWRPRYIKAYIDDNVSNAFLSFATKWDIKRIAYAASLGVGTWEYSKSETKKCSKSAKLFNAISVREKSGSELLRQHLNIDSSHVLDPTLLLDPENYSSLVDNKIFEERGNLMSYILDPTIEKTKIISKFEKLGHLKIFETNIAFGGDKSTKPQPPVEDWIQSFMHADYVITDSFHACVFSILFNKPFYVICNQSRGLERIESLLKTFDLETSIIFNESDFSELPKPFSNQKIQKTLATLRTKSIDFIKTALSDQAPCLS